MSIDLCLQIASEEPDLPQSEEFEAWANLALASHSEPAELTIRVVDRAESQALNQQYRKKNKPTNVLSFRCDLPDNIDLPILGDLVICAPIVTQEAQAQGKLNRAHWAHLTIHGILHLLGYDHETDEEAHIMEGLETQLIQQLGYEDPYRIEKLGVQQQDER